MPSELFVLRQITGLLDRGHDVEVFAIPPAVPARHERVARYDLLSRTHYQQRVPAGGFARLLSTLGLLVRSPFGAPKLLPCLNGLRFGREALNLQLIHGAASWRGRGRYDLVHAHFGPNGVKAVDLRAAGLFDAPIVTTFHGYGINVIAARGATPGLRRLFAAGDAFTVGSKFLGARAEKLGCPPDRMEILPMGVELPAVPRLAPPVSGPVRVLTVSRLSEEKGLTDAVAAVGRVASLGVQLEYRIIGGGPLEGELRAAIASAGLADIVTLQGVGTEDEVHAAYIESDVFLLPSVRAANGSEEAQGVVLQEAQAVGLPVLSTTIGGIPEGVVDGQSGWLVPPRNPEALADRLRQLCEDSPLRQRMGIAGRAFVESRFDIELLNDELVTIYERTRERWALGFVRR